MNARRTAASDPLVERIQQIDALVRDLRAERDRLHAEIARLGGEAERMGRDLETSRRRLEALEGERGTVYGRVQRLLETLGG